MPTDSASDGTRCRQGLGQVCHQVAQVSTLGAPLGIEGTIVNIEPGPTPVDVGVHDGLLCGCGRSAADLGGIGDEEVGYVSPGVAGIGLPRAVLSTAAAGGCR